MRRALVFLPFVLACAKTETAQTDSTAMASAALTEAGVAGTWTGTAMPQGSDSVIARWTMVCAGGACRGTAVGMADTVPHTYSIMGDSVAGMSSPYSDPAVPGAKVVDSWAFHLKDGKMVGTGAYTLADKPDSVVLRYRFEGSKAP